MLIVRVPSEPSRHRVAVWQASCAAAGAVQLGQGSWALPDEPPFAGFADRIVALVGEHGGERSPSTPPSADEATAIRIRRLYDDARRAEWTEFLAECGKCLAELGKEIRNQKFTLAEPTRKNRTSTVCAAGTANSVPATSSTHWIRTKYRPHLDACTTALETFTTHVYDAVGLN